MTRPATPRQRRRTPPPSAANDGPSTVSPERLPGESGYGRGAWLPDDARVRTFIEFLDRRWTSAELDPYRARRSVLLLSFVAVGCSMIVLSLAAAAAGFIMLVVLAWDLIGTEGCSPATVLVVTIGACVLASAARRRGVSR